METTTRLHTQIYFRNRFFRSVVNSIYWMVRPGSRPRVGHVAAMAEEETSGPIQRDEALLLFGIIRAIQPKTLVEFGFHTGRSTFNFLQALPADAQLYSYDVTDAAAQRAQERFSKFPNFHFLKKSQTLFSPEDIDNRPIDFAFIDASHDLGLNQKTFELIVPSLGPTAMIAVHDTGTWPRHLFGRFHKQFAAESPASWLNDEEFQHQIDERKFVAWIAQNYPDFQLIHFHSMNHLRHGITLLQRNRVLPTEATTAAAQTAL